MSTFQKIDYSLQDDVAFIRLNNPDSLNAISGSMGGELVEALDRGAEEARAVVLGSHGRAFSAGADLTAADIDISRPDRDMGKLLDEVFNPAILRLRDLPVPLVTAVRGAAAGIGCSFALMGDVIVAGRNAYFLQAFCNIGLVPDGGSAYLLARAVGRVRAMELMLFGERYPAEQAHAAGLVTRLVDDDEVDSVALELARRLAGGPTRALSMIRKAAWAALDSELEDQLGLEARLQREAGRTDDFVEGVTAFMEKRPPRFSGK
jgi:2-(1,2-epoxy-1,2-dihydrophenyl)acetyl-CoA isomerase